MGVKNVVKVMNFHALIRVDAAKRKARRYQLMEKEVMSMLDQIMNNRNLILDKSILKPNPDKPKLTIYLGSDFGFCGNYNSLVNAELDKNRDGDKILIGKKLRRHTDHVLLRINQDELEDRVQEVEKILKTSILRRQHSSIEVVFIRYLNASESCRDVHQIYPFEIARDADPDDYKDDFMIDGDIESLLTDLLATLSDLPDPDHQDFRLCVGKYSPAEYHQRVPEEDRGTGRRAEDGGAPGTACRGILEGH